MSYNRENDPLFDAKAKYALGRFVWLVPIYTTRRDDACTSFKVVFGSEGAGLKDLTRNAPGPSRYLKCEKDMSKEKIRRLALHRGGENLEEFLSETSHGFVGQTTNINDGRGDAYHAMYLLWAHDGKRDPSSKHQPEFIVPVN